MARPLSEMLTDRESVIMEIFWKLPEKRRRKRFVKFCLINRTTPPGPDAVAGVERKAVCQNQRSPTAVYVPVVSCEEVQNKAAKRTGRTLFRRFGRRLVLRLLEDDHLTTEQARTPQITICDQTSQRGSKMIFTSLTNGFDWYVHGLVLFQLFLKASVVLAVALIF